MDKKIIFSPSIYNNYKSDNMRIIIIPYQPEFYDTNPILTIFLKTTRRTDHIPRLGSLISLLIFEIL